MREFFQEHDDLEADRPVMKHSPVWWLEKMNEELTELYVTTSNDPLEQDKPQMGKELADVFWTMIGYARSIGMTPKEFEDNAIAGMNKIHQAYPAELFDGSIPYDEAYRLARPDKVKPIDVYNPSISIVDELID